MSIEWPKLNQELHFLTLNTEQSQQLNDEILGRIVEGQGQLRAVWLADCPSITDKAIQILSEHCPELFQVSLKGNPGLSDACLQTIGQSLIKLRKLRVTDCPQVHSTAFRLLSKLTELSELRLESTDEEKCWDLSSLKELVQSHPNLTRLQISGLASLPEQELVDLQQEQQRPLLLNQCVTPMHPPLSEAPFYLREGIHPGEFYEDLHPVMLAVHGASQEAVQLGAAIEYLESHLLTTPFKDLEPNDLLQCIKELNAHISGYVPHYRDGWMIVYPDEQCGFDAKGHRSLEGLALYFKKKGASEDEVSQLKIFHMEMEKRPIATNEAFKQHPEICDLIRKYIALPPGPDEVSSLMDGFATELHERLNRGEDPVTTAAWAHMRLTGIHPFADGNGRTARLLMNLIVMQAGFRPAVAFSLRKYNKAIFADEKAPGPFERWLRRRLAEVEGMVHQGSLKLQAPVVGEGGRDECVIA